MCSYSINIIVVWGRFVLTTLWNSKILHLITVVTIVLGLGLGLSYNVGPLEEQSVLLTTEPSLQPPPFFLKTGFSLCHFALPVLNLNLQNKGALNSQ